MMQQMMPDMPMMQSMPMMQMQMMQMQMMQMQMMQQGMMQMNLLRRGLTDGAVGEEMPAVGGMSGAPSGGMDAMGAPMMQGVQNADPDVAFVQVMIAHHEGAIAMAKAVLQDGADEEVKAWANQIIAAQQAEIAEMRDWLSRQAR
ncbi:MAG: DUF305 domain-containing protein [Cucumibacter sp.]